MTKQELIALLADNQMQPLFNALKSQQHRYENDLILLESQWSDLQTRERNGTISHEHSNLEAARIRKNLLDLIERSFGVPLPPNQVAGVNPRPFPTRLWVMLGVVLTIIVGGWLIFRPSAPTLANEVKKSDHTPSSALTSAVPEPSQASASQPKMLDVPPNPMSFNKGHIGDITFKFLSAELSDENPDNWLLRIKARAIKPAYGAHVGSSMFHIAYGDFEKVPVNINFPGLGPGETADGVMEFEVPKAYHEAKLLIYQYNDEPPLASIPFKW